MTTINIEYPPSTPPWVQFTLSTVIFIVFVAVLISSVGWAARDASKRGKSGCLVGLLVFITWPIGLLFWLIVRPAIETRLAAGDVSKRCVHPGCNANAHQIGTILGVATYRCDAGHEFTEQSNTAGERTPGH